MSRVEIATQAWGVVQDREGRVQSRVPVTIDTPVYAAATGGTLVDDVLTNSDGEIPGFVDVGTFNVTVAGETKRVEAVSGADIAGYLVGSIFSRKPAAGDRVMYISLSGNDANDGLSWGSAKRTIQTTLDLPGHDTGTFYIGAGSFVETVKPRQYQELIGASPVTFSPYATVIQPPNDAAKGLDLTSCPEAILRNIFVTASGNNYAGDAFYVSGSAKLKLYNCGVRHADATDFAGGKGGRGLYVTNTEGAYFENFTISSSQLALHLGSEASDNLFVNLRTSSCWQTHLAENTGGGNVFIHWKAVACRHSPSFAVDSNDGVYIGCDWDETGVNDINVTGSRNLFSKHTIAPGATLRDSGTSNQWQKPKLLGAAVFTGIDTILEDYYTLGPVDFSGATRMVVDGINISTAVKPTGLSVVRIKPVTGAPVVAPAGALVQKVPFFDASKKLLGWIELSALGNSTYQDAVMVDRPVAYWVMGETTGTVAADYMGIAHGVYEGSPTLGQTGATSDGSKAVLFDGSTSGQRVEILNASQTPVGSIADVFTIEMWVKRSNLVGNPTLFDLGVNHARLGLVAGTNQLVLAKSSVSNITFGGSVPADGSFHHVAATKNGATAKLYIDGADVTGAITNATLTATGSNAAIGGTASPGTPIPGLLHHVALYDYALTAARVAAHFAAA